MLMKAIVMLKMCTLPVEGAEPVVSLIETMKVDFKMAECEVRIDTDC